MDSLTQIVLGGAVAASIAPARHRRAALLAGTALGTLPDLDVLPVSLLLADPIDRMSWHRGPSHSLFVLPFVAWLIWALCKRRGGRVAEAPARWWWAIFLALVTHPLLDAFTVYGTQLFWPLATPPVMWSSVFIIDPLYTVWLLVACVIAWCWPGAARAQYALVAGLALSSIYLGWSLAAKQMIEHRAAAGLAAIGHADAPRVSVPMPFNTLLWRVVAMTPEGYLEGEYSLLADHGPMQFRHYPSDRAALSAVQDFAAVKRISWFNHGFQRARQMDDKLVLTDLRMGSEPDYFFNFAVAQQDASGQWRPLQPSEQIRLPQARLRLSQLERLWRRIWQTPAK
ncbi:MAG: metal-dependent hydrolase [Pseudomonadota bacterium]|nr:metal-dependent hydrolase [Pseudomonadota bacterium]